MKTEMLDTLMVGKRKKDGSEWHPLVMHCLDVAAVASILLEILLIQERLLGGRGKRLTTHQKKILCFFVAIHDLGKMNPEFQKKIRGLPEKNSVGHLKPAFALFWDNSLKSIFISSRFKNNVSIEDLAQAWFQNVDAGLFDRLFKATISHHGEPINLDDFNRDHRVCWEDDPIQHKKNVSEFLALIWDTLDLDDSLGKPHESFTCEHITNSFCISFSGLIQISDWIGSDVRYFKYLDTTNENFQQNTLDLCRARFEDSKKCAADFFREKGVSGLDLSFIKSVLETQDFGKILPFENLNSVQQDIFDRFDPKDGEIELIEAQMGVGKTEIALIRALQYLVAGYGMKIVYALPTKASAEQIHKRLETILQKAFPGECPKVLLATGDSVGAYNDEIKKAEERLSTISDLDDKSEATIYEESQLKQTIGKLWATESAPRQLSATFVVCTIDQVEQAALKNKHSTMIKFFLDTAILIIDEVHASDTYQMGIVKQVLINHRAVGGISVLLSDTLTESAKQELLGLKDSAKKKDDQSILHTPYPLLTQAHKGLRTEIALPSPKEKTFRVQIRTDLDAERLAEDVLDLAEQGSKICVLKNTVKTARVCQQALEKVAIKTNREHLLFKVQDKTTLVHAKFTAQSKKIMTMGLENRCGKKATPGGFVVIATQVVQQSLDLDFDRMFTDLCPMDILLQRAGRLHRHSRIRPMCCADPILVVMTPKDLLINNKHRSDLGLGTVYKDFVELGATLKSNQDKPSIQVDAQARERIENTLNRNLSKHFLGTDYADALAKVTKENDIHAKGLAAGACFDVNKDNYLELSFKGKAHKTRHGCDDVLIHFDQRQKDIFSGSFYSLSVSISELTTDEQTAIIDSEDSLVGEVDTCTDSGDGLEYVISLKMKKAGNILKSKLNYSRFGIKII